MSPFETRVPSATISVMTARVSSLLRISTCCIAASSPLTGSTMSNEPFSTV